MKLLKKHLINTCRTFLWSSIIGIVTLNQAHATSASSSAEIISFCKALANKLRTVSFDGCQALQLNSTPYYKSAEGRALMIREVLPDDTLPPKGKILFIGGIHGDEYAAISLTYLWLQTLLSDQSHYHWLFLPLANPDGLFRNPATRPNANSVDLNRNFPSPDWEALALKTWRNHYHKNPRRYPGPNANSEPETQWMVNLIERFKPDAIISIHAPYGLLDYDGPEHAQPNQIGHLKHRALGTYPGSLGRYAGEYLNIPVLTLELKSAGRMPKPKEIRHMLTDLEAWVQAKIRQQETDL